MKHLDLCAAPVDSTVICEATAGKNKVEVGKKKIDKRLGCLLSVISRPSHSSLWHVCERGSKIQVSSVPESPGGVCNAGGKELGA